MKKGLSTVKPGYIIAFVEGIDSFILNAHGFNVRQLNEIEEQMREPEEFEGMESGTYVFTASYCKPEKDHMGRVTVPGYWELEQDEYCKAKQERLRYEFQQFMEWEQE